MPFSLSGPLHWISPTRHAQRLRFDDELLLDIISFGGIAAEDHSIAWPPEYDTELSVAGFQECYQHAVSVLVRSEPDLVVKVVSLAGLAILKLVSWDDSIERRSKVRSRQIVHDGFDTLTPQWHKKEFI